jgi:hypothetical protein
MWQCSSWWLRESKGSGGSHKERSAVWVGRRRQILFSGLRCTSPSTIPCDQVKQRCMVHHEMPDFELQLGCLAMPYEKWDSPVEGVKGEATSYLRYIRSRTCSLSMHGKVPGASNYINCVGWLRYHRSCSYWGHPPLNNISDPLRQSLGNCQRNLSGLLHLTRVVLDMGSWQPTSQRRSTSF